MKRRIDLTSVVVSVVCVLAFLIPSVADACTGIRLTAGDGGVVVGRTMEFGVDVQSDVVVVPAGTELTSSLADKPKGIHYKSKYGMVGANFLNKPMIVDGANEKGLYVGALYLPGYASYPETSPEIASKAMAPEDYVAWLLANFATVVEVKANFDKVVLVQNPIKEIGGKSFPGHFLVIDSTGASVVIEPIDKILKIHDNPLGILTNSPSFDWHLTNLSNYVNLTATNVPQIDFGSKKIASFGQGSGLLGLPGDFTPPSRFVRAVAFSQSAVKLPTVEETVLQAFHLMNSFDIPVGAVQDVHEGGIHRDYTVWTSVTDLQNMRWAFRTYKDQTIHSVDIRKALAKAGNKVKYIEMDSEQPIEDVSTKFK